MRSAKHTKWQRISFIGKLLIFTMGTKEPDLNIIGNIWGLLARRIYHAYQQFGAKEDLCACLEYEWDKLDLKTMANVETIL